MDTAHRTSSELDPLWKKLDDLKRLDLELGNDKTSESIGRASEQIKIEIEKRLGSIPPFFGPALKSPLLLEGLWRKQISAYYDNPLPSIFKEKLATWLAPHCSSAYFLVTHSCALYRLGMSPKEIRQWIEMSISARNGLDHAFESLAAAPHPLSSWPEADPEFEENLITCCTGLFLGIPDSEKCAKELKELLGASRYIYISAFLANIKFCHQWVESHPEISYQDHPIVRESMDPMVQNEPGLAGLFQKYKEAIRQSIHGMNYGTESEEGYRELFENASDIIYTHDFEGTFLSINRAVERIAGYSRIEALQMRIVDIIAPEYLQQSQRMIDPLISGESPFNCELEILAKDGSRIALGISTRPIYRGGKAIAVQGIARDITKRKQTEAALQEANQKLEAWVNELEQRTREMTLLNDMGDILRACLSTEEAYHVIVQVAQQIFPVRVGALYIISSSRNTVESAAMWGDHSLAESAFSPQECWALRRGRTHAIEQPGAGLICRHIHQPLHDGYLCIPMMAQSEALGVLHLMQPDGVKMTEAKQRLAETMSEHIAMALSNLRLHETLRSQSIRDPLTGLFNRRFMEEALELEIRRAARNQRPLGMIMIDLDNFKYFNDTFGHEAGDLLLKELGVLLKSNIRAEDIACRYGGEEFTLIMPEGTGVVTRQRAEFFREAIQRINLQYRGNPLGPLTASMGVAVFPDHGRTAGDLITAADKALYRSKNAGRDRVTLAE
jgi:diguanylate cyclase (GGDEF)-like protein/PAS domain S-box-containing protein